MLRGTGPGFRAVDRRTATNNVARACGAALVPLVTLVTLVPLVPLVPLVTLVTLVTFVPLVTVRPASGLTVVPGCGGHRGVVMVAASFTGVRRTGLRGG